MSLFERVTTKPGYKLLAMFALLLLAGHIEVQEQPPATLTPFEKSAVQEKIETILPAEVAGPISRTAYPKTLAAIAHAESRGNHKAVGDGGRARGLFQVWGSLHGVVPETIEGQVEQANRLFLQMVEQYGYRQAVARWNGTPSNPRVKNYQRVVLAQVRELER